MGVGFLFLGVWLIIVGLIGVLMWVTGYTKGELAIGLPLLYIVLVLVIIWGKALSMRTDEFLLATKQEKR